MELQIYRSTVWTKIQKKRILWLISLLNEDSGKNQQPKRTVLMNCYLFINTIRKQLNNQRFLI